MTFNDAVQFVLAHEGGLVDDPHDSGGKTRFGISQASYPGVIIEELTRDGAIAIYKRDYWDLAHCGELPDGIDLLVFDAAVNQGLKAAIRMLQKAARVRVDGIIGPITLKAAREVSVASIAACRMYQYGLHPQFARYGLGWAKRLMGAVTLARQ